MISGPKKPGRSDPPKPKSLSGQSLLQTGTSRVIEIDVLDFRRRDVLDEIYTSPRPVAGEHQDLHRVRTVHAAEQLVPRAIVGR